MYRIAAISPVAEMVDFAVLTAFGNRVNKPREHEPVNTKSLTPVAKQTVTGLNATCPYPAGRTVPRGGNLNVNLAEDHCYVIQG
jgi:hypothetical protein